MSNPIDSINHELAGTSIVATKKADIDELAAALHDVPPGGASGDAPAWIIRLHRAACEVAGIGVREAELGATAQDAEELRNQPTPEPPPILDASTARRAWANAIMSMASGMERTDELRAMLVGARDVVEQGSADDLRLAAAHEAFDRGRGKDGTLHVAGSATLVVAPEQTPPPPAGSWRDAPPQVTADAQHFDAFAELVKWRHWAVRMLGGGAFESDDELRTCVGAAPDLAPSAPTEQHNGTQILTVVLNILRSPAGRAAIAEVIQNPPMRMPDGSYRDVPRGAGISAREAKRGDRIRNLRNGSMVTVWNHEPGYGLWVHGEGSNHTVNPDEWEIVIPVDSRMAGGDGAT